MKYYEAGMDLGLSRNIEESFRIFQGRILEEYEAMIEEMGFHVIDATRSIEEQQQQMRDIVMRELGESLRNGVHARRTRRYWMLLKPPLDVLSRPRFRASIRSELQGKLIVIEGPDAVGRTTQVARLRTWLEHRATRCWTPAWRAPRWRGRASRRPRKATRWVRSP